MATKRKPKVVSGKKGGFVDPQLTRAKKADNKKAAGRMKRKYTGRSKRMRYNGEPPKKWPKGYVPNPATGWFVKANTLRVSNNAPEAQKRMVAEHPDVFYGKGKKSGALEQQARRGQTYGLGKGRNKGILFNFEDSKKANPIVAEANQVGKRKVNSKAIAAHYRRMKKYNPRITMEQAAKQLKKGTFTAVFGPDGHVK